MADRAAALLRARRGSRENFAKVASLRDVKGCSALSLLWRRGTHLSLRARKSGSTLPSDSPVSNSANIYT